MPEDARSVSTRPQDHPQTASAYPTISISYSFVGKCTKNRKMMEQAPSCTQIRPFPSGTFLIDSLATVGGPRMPRSKRLLTLVQRLKKKRSNALQMHCKCVAYVSKKIKSGSCSRCRSQVPEASSSCRMWLESSRIA